MTAPGHDHAYLGEVTLDQLGALMLELASQIHVERQQRIALETLLVQHGVLAPEALEALADDKAVVEKGRTALDAALRRMFRIMTETGDARGPLRAEVAGLP